MDRPIHVCFSGKVYDRINFIFPEDGIDETSVPNVTMDE